MPLSVENLSELVAPSLRYAGVELVDLQWGRGILRLTIDKPGGVTLEDCEKVSTAVSSVLDAYDPIVSKYTLEVTSPGAERPVRTNEDWQAALGKNVRIRYRTGESETIVEGRVSQLSNTDVVITARRRTRKTEHVVPLADILSARIAVVI